MKPTPSKSFRPALDDLESRVVLSHAPAAHVSADALAGLSLAGTIRAKATLSGQTATLQGVGALKSTGRVSLVATADAASLTDATAGPVAAVLTGLGGKKGTITISSTVAGYDASARAAKLNYTIINSSGAFAGATGAGTILAKVDVLHARVTLTFRSTN